MTQKPLLISQTSTDFDKAVTNSHRHLNWIIHTIVLQASNTVPRFKESSFYQLYKGEIRPEDIPWLEFTGYSYQNVMRKTDRDSTLPSVSQFAQAGNQRQGPLGLGFGRKKEPNLAKEIDETTKLESMM